MPCSTSSAPRPVRFSGDSATQLVGLVRDGCDLVALDHDPQIFFEASDRIPAGWYQFVLEVHGTIHNPRVYTDSGEGFCESSSVKLEWSPPQQAWRAVTFLPPHVRHLRLDPSNQPDRFRLTAFLVDPIPADRLPEVLSRPVLRPVLPKTSSWQRIRRCWKSLAGEATFAQQVAGQEANVRVLFCERSHLSGVTVQLDRGGCEEGTITIELHAVDGDGMHPLRSATLDAAMLEAGEVEHLYWEAFEQSKNRFFFLRAVLAS